MTHMTKRLAKRSLLPCIATLFLFIVATGCSTSSTRCSHSMEQRGHFCYQGYLFDKQRSEAYKQGVRDGCHTANGNFTKNYKLSRQTQSYIQGWNAGRTRCRHIVPEAAKPGMRTVYQQDIDQRRRNRANTSSGTDTVEYR